MPEEKFTPQDLDDAVDMLGTMPFFPSESRGAVKLMLAKMVPHKRALGWLIGELVNHVGNWPGIAEVRGLLCTRFTPADGIDQWTTLPGYRAEDCEARFISEHEQRKIQERVGGYVDEQNRERLKELLSGKEIKRLQ